MKKELGKWLMDVAKYMMTALLLSSVFGEMDKPLMIILVSLGIFVTLVFGLLLLRLDEKANKQNSLRQKKKGK